MNSPGPKLIAGAALAVCALIAIAYFVQDVRPSPDKSARGQAPAAAQAPKSAAKPPTATIQSGVVLLPGETLVAPPEPVPAPTAPAQAPSTKPAPAPSAPRYTQPKPPVVARDSPRPPQQYSREERRDSYDRSTRSVCVNCGVVTSVARGDYDWEVRVRFDDGSREILRYYDRPRVQPGDAVHLQDGRLVPD